MNLQVMNKSQILFKRANLIQNLSAPETSKFRKETSCPKELTRLPNDVSKRLHLHTIDKASEFHHTSSQ